MILQYVSIKYVTEWTCFVHSLQRETFVSESV